MTRAKVCIGTLDLSFGWYGRPFFRRAKSLCLKRLSDRAGELMLAHR